MLTEAELKEALETKEFPRVTEKSIMDKIDTVVYTEVILDNVKVGTQCMIVMKNGWMSPGFSAPADARNFDPEIGRTYAFKKAFEPLWQLEGYLLREELHKISVEAPLDVD